MVDGRGSVFSISLCFKQAEAVREQVLPKQIPQGLPAVSYSTAEVLIVDDDVFVRKSIAAILQKVKCASSNTCRVEAVSSPEEAMDRISNGQTFGILIIDGDLGIDKILGHELVSILRDKYSYRGTIVGFTADSSESAHTTFKISGADFVKIKGKSESISWLKEVCSQMHPCDEANETN